MEITGLNKKLFEESSKAVKEVENTKNTLDSHIVNVNLRLQNVEKEKGALAKQIQEKM
jgi:prefoldin subunit 5